VAQFFGVYDVGADQLFGRWFYRKGADHVITTLKMIRARYPGKRVWVVQDNLSSHWTTEVRTVARQLGITLVATRRVRKLDPGRVMPRVRTRG
jgi:glycosyltransferase involved in cell wall biosynthesis